MRVTIDPAFDIELPEGWSAAADDEGGVSATGPDGIGLLHLIAFEQPSDSDVDPAEELYVFLEDQGIELEEDEIEDLELSGGAELSFCEYVAEADEDDEDEEEVAGPTYWIVGVATAPGNLVFSSYTCAADAIEQEREVVRSILATLRLNAST